MILHLALKLLCFVYISPYGRMLLKFSLLWVYSLLYERSELNGGEVREMM